MVSAPGLWERMRAHRTAYLFVAPASILVIALSIVTTLYTAGASLTDWSFNKPAVNLVGLANYLRAFQDDNFVDSLRHSAVFVAGVLVLSILLGLACGLALNERIHFRVPIRTIIIIPWVISEIVTGMIWGFMVGPAGIVTSAAKSMGVSLNILGEPGSAMLALIVAESWRSIGFVMLFVLAALQTIDVQLYEAAHVDGATRWARLRHITLPLITPTLLVVSILLTIGNFNLVSVILALTNGGPIRHTETTALFMWRASFQYFQPGYGSAVAVIMSAINMAAAIAYVRLLGRQGATE